MKPRSPKACFLCLALFVCLALPAAAAPPAKNLILLIADGASFSHYTLARWQKGSPLAVDAILVGAVKTYIANSVIADSAPAATTYATGRRCGQRILGLAPEKVTIPTARPLALGGGLAPLATVLEAAKLAGKSVGLVATSSITHATPAAFASHVEARNQEADIASQMAHHGLTVALGGGARLLAGKDGKPSRLGKLLKQRGYALPASAQELAAVKQGPIFGLFAPKHMMPEIDRPNIAPREPSLLDMTRAALRVLSANPKGFFLMVEGSQIDWAAHGNDPIYLLHDLLIFDHAVKAALDFADKNPGTLVIAVSDHATGGMTIGNRNSDQDYNRTSREQLLAPLAKMKASGPVVWHFMGKNPGPAQVIKTVKKYWGLDITPEVATEILKTAAKYEGLPKRAPGFNALGEVISKHYTRIGWTTHGHTGEDVPLYAKGPGKPTGLLDAPQLGQVMARALGLDLARATARLFVPAEKAFPRAWKVEKRDGAECLVIKRPGGEALLPLNGNLLRLGKKTSQLEGVVLHVAKTGRAYLPAQAVAAIKKALP